MLASSYFTERDMELRKHLREIRLTDGVSEDTTFVSNFVGTGSWLPLRAFLRGCLSTLWFAVFAVAGLSFPQRGVSPEVAPLALFLLYLAFKLIWEVCAYCRTHRAEYELNTDPAVVWTGSQFATVPCMRVKVGECVLVTEKARFPADVLVLATSAEDGTCYVSTAHILGEENLEVKRAVREMQRFIPCENSPQSFNFNRLNVVLKVDPPSGDYFSFSGKMTMKTLPRASVLSLPNLVLRGSVLHHTAWVLGLVLYTGMETKPWVHNALAAPKVSRFSHALEVYTVVAVAGVLALAAAMVFAQWLASTTEGVEAEDYAMYVLAIGSEVAVTAYIALDVARLVLLRRYSRKHRFAVFKSYSLSEDLGHVSFALVDKTGTVTENEVSVVEMIVDDELFLRREDKLSKVSVDSPRPGETRRWSVSTREKSELSFFDLREKMRLGHEPSFRRLCECLTLCNSGIPVNREVFRSPSKDEMALVEAANELGCKFLTRLDDECQVELFDSCFTYHLLAVRKFTPELKRTRVLVQGDFEDSATLYVTGTYSVLKDLLKLEPEDRVKVEQRLDDLMRSGLRTLLFCYRRIAGPLLAQTKIRAQNARLAHINVEGKAELLLKDLEKEITLLGLVGLTDQVLADTVDCIDVMRRADIATWLVSGDSEANTLACAYGLGLLPTDVSVIRLKDLSALDICARRLLKAAKDHCFQRSPIDLRTPDTPKSISPTTWNYEQANSVDFALCIDGKSLSVALQDRATRQLLTCLLFSSTAACFYRMLPAHKSDLARLIRKGLRSRPVVVAVGDDGSNVQMIREASVGVGVTRAKDMRAANTSDVTLPHFSHLGALLLDAKEYSALLSHLVLLLIYSTTLLHTLQLTYFLVSDVTALPLFSMEARFVHSALLAFLPCVACVLSSRLQPEDRDPLMYSSEVSLGLSRTGVLTYLGLALAHSVCVALLVPLAFIGRSGTNGSLQELEIAAMTAATAVVAQHCCQEAANWQVYTASALSVCSVLCYYGVSHPSTFQSVWSSPPIPFSILLATMTSGLLSLQFTKIEFSRRPNRAKVVPLPTQSAFVRKLRTESRALIDSYQSSNLLLSPDVNSESAFDLHPWQMRFLVKTTERDYVQHYTVSHVPSLRLVLLFFALQLLSALPHSADAAFVSAVSVSCGVCVGILLASWVSQRTLRHLTCFALVFVLLTFAVDAATRELHGLAYTSVPVGLLFFAKEQWLQNAAVTVLSCALVAVDAGVQCYHSSEVVRTVGVVAAHLLVSGVAAMAAYRGCARSRSEYQLLKETEMRMAQNENILSILLPDFVRLQVKNGLRYIAEDKGTVTVLFCEICDFDKICAAYTPGELTELIDDVFQRIDELCATLGVAKIETVGKVYLACAGLTDHEHEVESDVLTVHHSMRALELAAEIVASFRMYRLQTGENIQFKVGVHTGPVIAGVVGYHKPQFSLMGDTVNTASRMSTTIDAPNTIQISEATYTKVRDEKSRFEFLQRSLLVKGKGQQVTYIVKEREESFGRRGVRSGSTSEEPAFLRNRPRRRSSLVDSLRDSLASQEAVAQNEMEAVEQVRLFSSRDSASEAKFLLYFHSHKARNIPPALLVHCCSQVLLAAESFASAAHDGEYQSLAPGVVFVVGALGTLATWVRIRCVRTFAWQQWLFVGIYALAAGALTASHALSLPSEVATLALCLLLVLMNHCSGLLFRHVLLGSTVSVVPWTCVAIAVGEWPYGVFAALFSIQHCIASYFDEKRHRTAFTLSDLATNEVQRTEQLLTQMLPVHAYEGLKLEEWVTDKLIAVTILYADISGFTAWSASRTPQEVVNRLSYIYASFDRICVRLGVYKVHTIGDCYVAMSATNNGDQRDPSEECRRMLTLAGEMVEVLRGAEDEQLQMRIGLHCGDVVGSITGSKLVRYDIYGNDVLIANKMESNGVAGKINVSEDLKGLLELSGSSSFVFSFHKSVYIPDISHTVNCYLCSRRV